MSQQDKSPAPIRLAITPTPTDEEVAAIAAVVTALVVQQGADEGEPQSAPDRWARAGREEALRGPLWPAGSAVNGRA